MSYPRLSSEISAVGDYARGDLDWDPMVLQHRGFTASGVFKQLAKYIMTTDGTDIYISNSYQVIYGGPNDAGGIDGDDADATAILTQAMTDVAATGGIIYVAEGTFMFDITGKGNPLMVLPPNVNLIGAGIDATIFKAKGTMPDLGIGLFIMHANSSLQNLTVDMDGDNLTWLGSYTPASWFGAVSIGNYLHGVTNDPGTDAYVNNAKFINCDAAAGVTNISGLGLNVLYGKGIKVRNVSFYNCYAGQFITYQPTTTQTELSNQWYDIDGVYAENCYVGVYWEIGSANLKHVTTRDCTVGILINAEPSSWTYGTIENPTLINCSGGGIVMNGPVEWIKIVNPHVDGTGAAAWGIRYVGKAGSTCTISNPTLLNCGEGFRANDAGVVTWNGGRIYNANSFGVFASADITLKGCEIENSGTHGVYITHAGGSSNIGIIEGCNIHDNTNDGVRLDGASYVTVQGNSIRNNDVGVREMSVSDYNLISENILKSNTTADIAYVGTHTKILSSNIGVYTPQGTADASGVATILSGATAIVVTHGCSFTPALKDITVMLGEDPTNTPGAIWISAIGATTFNINCENDPGASNLDVAWVIRRV